MSNSALQRGTIPELADITADKIDVDKAIELRLKGLTYQDIANYFGCAKQSVWQRLQPFIPKTEGLKAFKQHKADLLAAKQAELLFSLTPEAIKDTTPYQRVGMFGILYDKERLERGQATEIVEYNEFEEQTQDLASKKRAIEERLAAMGVDVVDVTPEKVSDTNLEPKSGGMDQAEA